MWPSAIRAGSAPRSKPLPSSRTASSTDPLRSNKLDRHVARLRMHRRVREQLACGAEEQHLLRVPPGIGEVEPDAERPAPRRTLAGSPQRGFEARLLEHVRMELEHRLPQLGDRRLDGRVGSGERLVRLERPSLGHLLEVVASREQVLDRLVVEPLGERAALTLAGAQRLGDQPAPPLGELGDRSRSLLEHGRQEHGGEPDPEQVAGLDGDEPRRLRLRVGRMRDGLEKVRDDGDRARECRQSRPEAKCDRDRHEKVREPRFRVGASREDDEHRDRRHVDRCPEQREPRRDRPRVDPDEHCDRVDGEDGDRDQEVGPLLLRVRQRLRGDDQRQGEQTQPGHSPLDLASARRS